MSGKDQSVFYQLVRGANYKEPDLWFVAKTVISSKFVYTVLASRGFASEGIARTKMRELEANLAWEEYIELFRHI